VTTLLMMTGFTFLSRLTQIAPPPTRFVFLGAGIRLGLPSHPASRRRSCLRLGVSTTSSSRGLPPPIDRPCRAYTRAAPLRGAAGPAPAPGPSRRRARTILLNSNRYSLTHWYQARRYHIQSGYYLDFESTGEHRIRSAGSVAMALAVSLRLGSYDSTASTGLSGRLDRHLDTVDVMGTRVSGGGAPAPG
jgi:hypothetical protein